MKKIILSMVGSLLISICMVEAQQTDKERTREDKQQQTKPRQTEQRERMGDRNKWQQQTDRNQSDNSYANEGMVIIDKDEIPSSLKQTLQQDQYEGWENGTIYHNTNTGEYVIAPRAYRFDKNGKEIEMADANPGYGNRQERSSRYSPENRNDQAKQSATPGQQAEDPMDQRQTTATEDQNDNASQQPSTGYRSEQDDKTGAGTQTQPGQSGREQYSTEDMIEVQAEQIPESLRRTLGETKYNGWEENGTLYQDPSTNEYVLVMDKTGNASAPRTYKFDKNGQAKDGGDDAPARAKQQDR